MIKKAKVNAWILLGAAAMAGCATQQAYDVNATQNFVYFGLEHSRIEEPNFLASESIVGAQLKYRWRELEPERDRYDLQPISEDLAFLEEHGKRLFIQLQDVSFEEAIVNVPDYLRDDPVFGGGVAQQFEYDANDETVLIGEGWVARRWDPAVRERFVKLLEVLGESFDGRIEGLNLPETSIGFGDSVAHHPSGFSYESYLVGVNAIMTAAREAFPRSHVIQYANFMPGEWLPWDDHGYLRSVYEHAGRIGVGVGGPDLLPYRKGQQNHSLPLIAARGSDVVAGVAVQWGNLEERNPENGEQVTVDELYRFARDSLRLDYIFWGTQEPYYTDEILPYLRSLSRGVVPAGAL
jgi:hypothetical protein